MRATVTLFFLLAIIGACMADTYECPQGWAAFEKKCFFRNDTLRGTFDKNFEYCNSIGAQMITTKTFSELSFVSYYARFNIYYLGIKKVSDVAWRWIDGAIPMYYFWEASVAEKQNRATLQPCAIIDPSSGRWKDSNCMQQFNFMCEKNATSQDLRKIKEERERLDKEADRIKNELNKTTSDIDDLKKQVDENKKYCETTVTTNVNKMKTEMENKFNVEIGKVNVNASNEIKKVDEQCTKRTK
ncbi:Clec4g protein-like protein, partial [Leptotrombidium deliense]